MRNPAGYTPRPTSAIPRKFVRVFWNPSTSIIIPMNSKEFLRNSKGAEPGRPSESNFRLYARSTPGYTRGASDLNLPGHF